MMCHAAGRDVQSNNDVLTASMPAAGLPGSGGGYYGSLADLLVRADVTYLRQDFSMMLAVNDSRPLPETQRFDFVVRTRTLEDDELQPYKDKFDKPKELPPHRQAALAALRQLTGQDVGPTAEAWRNLVKSAR